MPQQSSPRVAVVTGGAGAVGRAIADRLARNGMALMLVDRNVEGVNAIAQDIARARGIEVRVAGVDLTDADGPKRVMDEVDAAFGRLDSLVNNAGASKGRKLGAVERADWDAVLAINLTVPMLLCQEALRFWEKQRSGSVVNMGSRTWLSGPGIAYTSSKAGLVGLTRALAVQLGPLNVTVNAVAPSYLRTAFTQSVIAGDPQEIDAAYRRLGVLPRIGTAEDVANAVAFLLSEDATFITGEVLHVAGGAQLAPRPEGIGL